MHHVLGKQDGVGTDGEGDGSATATAKHTDVVTATTAATTPTTNATFTATAAPAARKLTTESALATLAELLGYGVAINEADSSGHTPLLLAARWTGA